MLSVPVPIDEAAKLATLVGAIIAGSLAFFTFWMIGLHTRRLQWFQAFQAIYEAFWNNDETSKFREMLVSDSAWEDWRSLIQKRLATDRNELSHDQNVELEKLDRFCALLVRIAFLRDTSTRRWRRRLQDALFLFWLERIKERQELLRYIELYWGPLYEKLDQKPRSRRFLEWCGHLLSQFAQDIPK